MNTLRLLIFAVALAACACSGAAQTRAAQADAAKVSASLAEAPHLFHSDGKVVAKWIADGKLEEKEFPSGSAIELPQFRELLGDSLKLRSHAPEKAAWEMPSKLLVISDVEGNYDAMRRFLRGNDVIDENGRWSFDDGHLVCVGDFVDRGTQVTEVLWLLYRLAGEAETAGGHLHFVLGNHEVMMMDGDVRYTAPKYTAVANLLGVSVQGLLGADTEIGRWLRSRNCLVRVGQMLFVHAGLSPKVVKGRFDLDAVNTLIRKAIEEGRTAKSDQRALALAWSMEGPLWYRGYFKEHAAHPVPIGFGPRPTAADIDRILEYYGAATIVIGHTKVTQVSSLYGKRRVLAIDIPWIDAKSVRGLFVEGDRFDVVDIGGVRERFDDK